MMLLSGGSLYGQHMAINDEQSHLWIEGKSNVNSFSCDANQYELNSQRLAPALETETPTTENLQVEISIQVKGFDCGKKRMNRDLLDALKADQYDSIHYEYQSTEDVEYDEESDIYRIIINGILTVAGQSNNIQLSMNGYLMDENIRAKGKTEIIMTNYNVEPPTAMFGLVRVNNTLTVHFDLTAAIVE
ncbi:MAG: YceI family protein [Balneolaceae bacterium]